MEEHNHQKETSCNEDLLTPVRHMKEYKHAEKAV